MAEKLKGEVELERIFEKVDEALGNGGYTLRRRGGASDDKDRWIASTPFDQEEVAFRGPTPGMALIGFLMTVLEYEQGRGAETETAARGARDRIDRVKRAIDSL